MSIKNQRLTVSLQNLQYASKETREKLSEELSKRQEEILKLQGEKTYQDSTVQLQLKDKLIYIEKLTDELEIKNKKVCILIIVEFTN